MTPASNHELALVAGLLPLTASSNRIKGRSVNRSSMPNPRLFRIASDAGTSVHGGFDFFTAYFHTAVQANIHFNRAFNCVHDIATELLSSLESLGAYIAEPSAVANHRKKLSQTP